MARSSNGAGYETLNLVIRVRLPYGLLNDFIAGATGVQSAFIRPMRSARYRDLQLDAVHPAGDARPGFIQAS